MPIRALTRRPKVIVCQIQCPVCVIFALLQGLRSWLH
jgi:hypothetical protein